MKSFLYVFQNILNTIMGFILSCCFPNENETAQTEDEKEYLFTPKPNSYQGERNMLNQRHGRGVYFYGNGDIYDGEWKNDAKHGEGTYRTSDGKVLAGIFCKDKYIGCRSANSKHDKTESNRAKPLEIGNNGLVAGSVLEEQARLNSNFSEKALEEANMRNERQQKKQRDQMRRDKHQKTVEKVRAKYNIS